MNELRSIESKLKSDSLCIRYTKWNEEKLRKLYDELRNIRLKNPDLSKITLLKQKLKSEIFLLPSNMNKSYLEDQLENNLSCSMIERKEIQNQVRFIKNF